MSSFLSSLVPIILAAATLLPLFTTSTHSSLLDFTGHMVGVRSTKVPGVAEKQVTPEYCKESLRIANGNLNLFVSSDKLRIDFKSPVKQIFLETNGSESYYMVSFSNITCKRFVSYDKVSKIVENSKGVLNATYFNGSKQEYCRGFCSNLDDLLDYCDEVINKEVSYVMNISSGLCEY